MVGATNTPLTGCVSSRCLALGLATCLALGCTSQLAGQSYDLSIGDATAPEGGMYSQDVSLTLTNASNVAGVAYGVCHDSTLADVCAAEIPPAIMNLAFNSNPFFVFVAIDDRTVAPPGSTDGVSTGILLDGGGMFTFPDNSTQTILRIHYRADPGTSGSTSTTSFCTTPNGVGGIEILCCGSSVPATTLTSGIVTYGAATPLWTIGSPALTVEYDPATGICASNCTLPVDIVIANTATNLRYQKTAGLNVSLRHDASLLTPSGVTLGSEYTAMLQVPLPSGDCAPGPGGGIGPDHFATDINSLGISVEILNTFFSTGGPTLPYCLQTIDWELGKTAMTIDYSVDTSSLIGNTTGLTTSLDFMGIGNGVDNAVVIHCPERLGSRPPPPHRLEALTPPECVVATPITIHFVPVGGSDFVRGDCNADGARNIADAVFFLNFLFPQMTGSVPTCDDACDSNNDESLTIADAVALLNQLFAMAPAPAPTSCGNDPDGDATLVCASFAPCP